MKSIFTFPDLLTQSALTFGAKKALIAGDKSLTYAELEQRSDALALRLQDRGIQKGDRIGILLDKNIESVIAMFGVAKAAAVFVNLNTRLTPAQVAYQIENAGMKVVITSANKMKLMPEADPSIEVIDSKSFETLCEETRQLVDIDLIENDLATILYTSGSTGMPKGVALSHGNLALGAKIVTEYLKNTEDDILISVLPFNFDYGLNQLTSAFLVGATLVLQKSMFPQSICDTLINEKVTGFAGVPTIWVQLLQPFSDFKERTFPHLRYITNSGGAFPLQYLDQIKDVLKTTDVYLMYGLTEAFRSTYLEPKELEARSTSMGKAIPNVEVAVVNQDGKRCRPGEKGQLVHRGGVIFQGYWKNEEATDKVLKPWPFPAQGLTVTEMAVWSGDIVTQCEEGFLYFVGRNDEMIKSAGYRISPQEVEEAIYSAGYVNEVVVFGVKDDQLTQKIKAVLSLKEGHEVTHKELTQYCRKQLPDFMVPHNFEILPELPKTANGKIDRSGIKKQAVAVLS